MEPLEEMDTQGIATTMLAAELCIIPLPYGSNGMDRYLIAMEVPVAEALAAALEVSMDHVAETQLKQAGMITV